MTSRGSFRVERLLESASHLAPVLGFDTGTSVASLGVCARGKIVATLSRPATSHGAALPAMVDEILHEAGVAMRDLGALAIGIGPGSYTGLRVGLSYAKGVALASGVAVVGVPSFDALALAAFESSQPNSGTLIRAVVDARRAEIYTALYRIAPDGLEKKENESVTALDHLASRIAGGTMLVGDAAAKDAAALAVSRGQTVAVLESGVLDLRGACVAALGAARYARGERDRAAALEPLYLRAAEATFKPAAAGSGASATEGPWSNEKRN